MPWLEAVLIAIDQLINATLGAWPDETLSSRAWRLHLAGNPLPARIINAIFFLQHNHCKQAYESERFQRQLPPEIRR